MAGEWKPCDIEVKVFICAACCQGKCDECKGIYNKHLPAAEWIFCTHECHDARNRGV